jgi:hypothetical protein
MLNWDVTCGDDCIAIKGVGLQWFSVSCSLRSDILQNSSNIVARNFVCRGGEGIAFGSLGQYANMVRATSQYLYLSGALRLHEERFCL